jgi:hypothetical protein
MICTSRGPAFGPAAGQTPVRWGEDGRGPGLNSLLAGDKTSSRFVSSQRLDLATGFARIRGVD